MRNVALGGESGSMDPGGVEEVVRFPQPQSHLHLDLVTLLWVLPHAL